MPKALTFLFILITPVYLSAQDWKRLDADDPMLSDLKSALAGTESIKGDIKQEKAFAFLTEKLISTGVFIYQKESKLRWEFAEPIEYIILINENSMRLKEDGEEKKYKGMNQILRQVKEIILGCIDGSILSNSNYKTAFYTDGEHIRIELQPKAKNLREFIKQIDAEFDKEEARIEKVQLTDPSDDLTEIMFTDIKVDQKIDETVFTKF